MKIDVLAIDQQNDFHDIPDDVAQAMGITPALPVPGSWEDSKRFAGFIKKAGHLFNSVTMTMDTHQQYDVGHSLFWKDKNGNSPLPLFLTKDNADKGVVAPILAQDIKNGTWVPRDTSRKSEMIAYAEALESEGKYAIIVWPDHCLVGTPGYDVVQPVREALLEWERKFISRVNFVTKGHNPFTEHYGGFQAEVPINNDPSTQLNVPLIQRFQDSDMVLLTGQALSHCVASTVRQLADNFGDENIKKLVLLVDTCSAVPGFEKNADDFVSEMMARGMQVAKTTDIGVGRDELRIGEAVKKSIRNINQNRPQV